MIETTLKIKEKLDKIPLKPGIYKFLDADGRIVYIGKSKELRKRVSSYFTDNPKWEKVQRMIPFINDLEYIVTDTHLESRLLECELIKSIKPIFNTQMKNDENYAYLTVEENNSINPITISYERKQNSFGPFRRRHSLYKTIEQLKNIYPITKTNGRFSFEYHLFPVAMDKLSNIINRSILLEILSDELIMESFIYEIEQKMKEAAFIYKFETASMYRDLLLSLNYLKSGLKGYKNMFTKSIILKIPTDSGVKLFFVSRGQIVLKKSYKRLSTRSYELFIKTGSELLNKLSQFDNEKMSIDYRDIIYSEILSLPKDMVNILNQ